MLGQRKTSFVQWHSRARQSSARSARASGGEPDLAERCSGAGCRAAGASRTRSRRRWRRRRRSACRPAGHDLPPSRRSCTFAHCSSGSTIAPKRPRSRSRPPRRARGRRARSTRSSAGPCSDGFLRSPRISARLWWSICGQRSYRKSVSRRISSRFSCVAVRDRVDAQPRVRAPAARPARRRSPSRGRTTSSAAAEAVVVLARAVERELADEETRAILGPRSSACERRLRAVA